MTADRQLSPRGEGCPHSILFEEPTVLFNMLSSLGLQSGDRGVPVVYPGTSRTNTNLVQKTVDEKDFTPFICCDRSSEKL